MRSEEVGPQVHVCLSANGHQRSTDCWCEPINMWWQTNALGIKVLIVIHDDEEDVTIHHAGIIFMRDSAQDWITRALDEPFQPKEPPDEPNDRRVPPVRG